MIVTCGSCGARFNVDTAKLSSEKGRFKCSKCGNAVQFGKNTSKQKRILIADDTDFFRSMLEDLLKEKGYEILTAKDGEEAIIKAKHELPDLDLLLLDMVMPKADGFEIIKELRKGVMGRNLQILTISGLVKSEEDRMLMKELGVKGYIDKNTPPDEIVRRIDMLFNEAD